MGIEKLTEHGPHGRGLDKLLNAQRLEQAMDLMKNDPSLPFATALQMTDADLSQVPTSVLRDIVQSQPPEVQQQIASWASGGDFPGGANRLGLSNAPDPATSLPPTASGANAPAGSPLANATSDVARVLDPAPRILPGHPQGGPRTDGAPSQMIQRLFGEGRAETAHNQIAVPRSTGGGNPHAETSQAVAMPRNAQGDAGIAERVQQQSLPAAALQRGDGNAVRPDVVQQPPSQALQQARDGLAGNAGSQAPTHAAPTAQPQGAAQTSAFSGSPQAAQAVPLAQGRPETMAGQQQQAFARADAAGTPSQAALPQQAVPTAQARPDALGTQLHAQGQTQLAAPAQARPEAMPPPLAPQLAGLTVLANPQAPTLNPQLNQNAVPVAPGTENAVSQARDALLAPAGHTLAGFLRRDHRGRQPMRNRPLDWALALVPGLRRRGAEGEAEPVSFQWLFWLLTIVAYGAVAAAIITMVPSGGRLLDGSGAPVFGAYALLVGAVAAIASWLVGRRLTKR